MIKIFFIGFYLFKLSGYEKYKILIKNWDFKKVYLKFII